MNIDKSKAILELFDDERFRAILRLFMSNVK